MTDEKPSVRRSKLHAVTLDAKAAKSRDAAIAKTVLRPTINAALLAATYSSAGTSMSKEPDQEAVILDLGALTRELSDLCAAANQGDLGRPEAMLIAQAHSLDAIFTKLAWMARQNISSNFDAFDRLLRLGLKAQSQCRATIETLAAVKNPPVVIARQANVTSGPQQINNGLAREIQTKQNKLLEQSNGERLDIGQAGQAIGGDMGMAAVGAVNGTQD